MENNCPVLQTDDHSHVTKQTPLDIKRRELAAAKAALEPQERAQHEQSCEHREGTHLRPLGGVK